MPPHDVGKGLPRIDSCLKRVATVTGCAFWRRVASSRWSAVLLGWLRVRRAAPKRAGALLHPEEIHNPRAEGLGALEGPERAPEGLVGAGAPEAARGDLGEGEAARGGAVARPSLCCSSGTRGHSTIPTQMTLSPLTAFPEWTGGNRPGPNPSNHRGFLDAFTPMWLAKHLPPDRHVACPMPLHLLAAVDDPIQLPEGEVTLVLFAELREIRGAHRQQVQGRHHAFLFCRPGRGRRHRRAETPGGPRRQCLPVVPPPCLEAWPRAPWSSGEGGATRDRMLCLHPCGHVLPRGGSRSASEARCT